MTVSSIENYSIAFFTLCMRSSGMSKSVIDFAIARIHEAHRSRRNSKTLKIEDLPGVIRYVTRYCRTPEEKMLMKEVLNIFLKASPHLLPLVNSHLDPKTVSEGILEFSERTDIETRYMIPHSEQTTDRGFSSDLDVDDITDRVLQDISLFIKRNTTCGFAYSCAHYRRAINCHSMMKGRDAGAVYVVTGKSLEHAKGPSDLINMRDRLKLKNEHCVILSVGEVSVSDPTRDEYKKEGYSVYQISDLHNLSQSAYERSFLSHSLR